VEFLLLQQNGDLVDIGDVVDAENATFRDVAEVADFLSGGFPEFLGTPAKDDGGSQSEGPQIFYTVLGGLCLLFVRQYRDEADKGEEEIFGADPELKLPEGFQKDTRFDVPDGSTDLDQTNIGFFATVIGWDLGGSLNPILDFVRNVGDNLDRLSEIISLSFFQNHMAIHLSSSNVVVLCQMDVQESFVVSQIQIGFSSIVQNEYLTMFKWRHRSGIDVQVRVDLDGRHAKTTGLQKTTHTADGNALPEATDNTSCDNNVLHF
jgi:hypothetical protein